MLMELAVTKAQSPGLIPSGQLSCLVLLLKDYLLIGPVY